MSCGQQALDRAGIEVDKYYASEIDKYAIQVTMANYPNTIQLGSVVDINALELPKIDLLIGGSPCQSFSFAGKRKGMSTKDEQEILTLDHYLKLKSEGYEFEGQSYLFWEYMRILEELRVKNPNVLFLLENVEMGAKWEKVLSNAIGVRGIHINSALVSAQNRKRIYWINWGMKPMGLFGDMESIIEQPKDRKILLKDILQDNPNAKYFISNKMKEHLNSRDSVKIKNGEDKSGAITTNGEGKQGNNSTFVCESVDEKYFLSEKVVSRFREYKGVSNIVGSTAPDFRTIGQRDEVYADNGKMGCLNATDYKQPKQIIVHNTQQRSSNRPSIKKNKNAGGSGHLSRKDGKTYSLDTGNTNAVEIVANGAKEQVVGRKAQEDGTYKREYEVSNDQKSKTLETNKQKNNVQIIETKQIVAMRGRGENNQQQLEYRKDNKTNSLTSVQKDNLILELNQDNNVPKIYNNKRLNETIEKHKDNLEHGTLIDSYNKEIHKDKCITVSTRINASNCTHIVDRKIKQISTNNKSNGGTQPYQQDRIYDIDGISPALSACKSDLMITSGTLRTHKDGEGFREVHSGKGATVPARAREDGSGQNVVMITSVLNENQLKKFNPSINSDKANTLTLAQGRAGSSEEYMDSVSKIANITSRIRRLTPIECERLQTVSDNYTASVSDSQRYRMIGNGWTIEVIAYLFKYLL